MKSVLWYLEKSQCLGFWHFIAFSISLFCTFKGMKVISCSFTRVYSRALVKTVDCIFIYINVDVRDNVFLITRS